MLCFDMYSAVACEKCLVAGYVAEVLPIDLHIEMCVCMCVLVHVCVRVCVCVCVFVCVGKGNNVMLYMIVIKRQCIVHTVILGLLVKLPDIGSLCDSHLVQ